ncbi:M20 aminoacylase family protein [Sinorhizobium mexicanum]|uniref:Amidohydrolase n=1 Tax=Sinorhizobium mexicanum TaxID=375549 RepID=A0A859QIA3_9HYPH|nr:M20 aminoacylase family protein [Sinorhizobium mexicanum]MBP1885137.1 hippurate hydrolase [Sinorhizobium mexicanum]QLL64394.1 amidohydrolase [Sinorhizobium mexicanum]
MKISPALISSNLLEEAIKWRHFLHSIPEIAYNEAQTSAFISTQLQNFGLRVDRGYGGTGVVGSLTKGTSSRAIGLRADMDALPVIEAADLPYKSRKAGMMHACGHDGHMAMLLAAALLATELDFDGTVRFIFQPAEENEGGARRMIDDGLFRDLPVDAVFGIHNWPQLPIGTFAAHEGPIMAAFSIFDIEIRGRGAHGAMPHQGVDPVVAGCAVVSALQSVISRNVSPLDTVVLSATQIHAGDAYNTIPDRTTIRGTGRWFSEQPGRLLQTRLEKIATDIASAHGCEATVHYEPRYPVTVNDARCARLAQEVAAANGMTIVQALPSMGSEDFAFMLQVVPGAYAWLGSGSPTNDSPLHSPNFDFNDEVIPHGVAYWGGLIQSQLRPAPSRNV